MVTYVDHDETGHVARMMVRYGGGFVHHLGEALIHADRDNTARIKEAFPEYWQRYNDMPESE